MAINDSNEGTTAETLKAGLSQPAAPQHEWSFDRAGLYGAPIPKTVYSEYYTKMKEGLIEIFKHSNNDIEISVIDLDNINNPGLAFSNIIVAIRFKSNPDAVAYHILTLEATGDKILPIVENFGNYQVEVMRFTANAIDDILRTKAEERVRGAFKSKTFYFSEGTVVPSDFNPEDKQKLHKLALNTGLACTTELKINTKGFNDISLPDVPKTNNLFVNIDFSRTQIEDAVGNIMRSDVTTNFGTRKQQQADRSINTGERDNTLSISTGFIDLLWAPMNPQSIFNPYMNNNQMPQTQKYAARYTITNLDSNFSYTPGMILLALATSVTIRDNNNWINTFRPTPLDKDTVDLRDIGALNIEANLENDQSGWGKPIDTKSETFQLTDLGQLISALIRPGLVISLDCPESGPQSWYLSMFAAASRGNQTATDVIYAAANKLTGGNFGRYFQRGMPMFADNFNTVHLGHWFDRKGRKRDLRDIDTLAICNIAGERNPEFIRGYSDTFLRRDVPLFKRLADRKAIIRAASNDSAVFTGYADRVTFTSAFINALVQGVAESGLLVRINSQVLDDINNQRGYAQFVDDSILTGSSSFLTYNTFQGNQNQNMGYQGYRW